MDNSLKHKKRPCIDCGKDTTWLGHFVARTKDGKHLCLDCHTKRNAKWFDEHFKQTNNE